MDFAEFTESGYRRALVAAKERFSFEPFGTRCDGPHVLWRHDVDFSVHRAARLARIEADEGVTTTYFFLLHSNFYNLLERSVTDLARGIVHDDRHRLGLHFDSSFYGSLDSVDALGEKVATEAAFLADLLAAPVEAFAFHNPGLVNDDLAFDAGEIGGLANAYARSVKERYEYVSDSNGYWRFRRLLDVLEDPAVERAHVVTHPEWWQAEPLSPRDRVVRCVEGRAARTLAEYDDDLLKAGRENIG